MVGSAMALDLEKAHEVVLADFSEKNLERAKARSANLSTQVLDVTDKNVLTAKVQPFEMVLLAVPGFLGFEALKTIIQAGKDVVDISFFPENALDLHELAKEHGVTAIVDCGVAPGIDNLILGRLNEEMTITRFECLVGGLPKVKTWPWCYKAPFSPVDVIEEYVRPARYVEGGKLVVREALSDAEFVEFDKVGTLESFNTDGLRSIIHTMPHIPDMKEKTLRYPGHIEYVKVLKQSGFFDTDALDFTSQKLFDQWLLGEEEEEMTVMRITVEGTDASGAHQRVVHDLYDEYDSATKTSSMARTTGYTATAAVNMFLAGHFTEKGVFPPELVGKNNAAFQFIFEYLAERGVELTKQN